MSIRNPNSAIRNPQSAIRNTLNNKMFIFNSIKLMIFLNI